MGGARAFAAPRRESAPIAAAPAPGVAIPDFSALVALVAEKRDIQLKIALETEVRLVRFEQGRIEFELAPGGSPRLAQVLTQKLQDWTGMRWMVARGARGGAPTLREQAQARESERRSGIETDPLVASILARFPGAEIIAVRSKDDGGSAPAPDLGYEDDGDFDDG
jgi:DNA polymerase-3 subunit gamma/tau